MITFKSERKKDIVYLTLKEKVNGVEYQKKYENTTFDKAKKDFRGWIADQIKN